MKYVNDEKILKRIGIYNKKDIYAVYSNEKGFSSEEIETEENLHNSFTNEEIEVEIDNSKCNADFEKVSDGYEAIENYMHGDILVYKKGTLFPELIEIYDKTGLYKMESIKGTKGYLGNEGKAKCIAFPQCKFMNSTIFDNIAEHKIYTSPRYIKKSKQVVELGTGKVEEYIYGNNNNTHISFDKWIVIGVVFGKLLKVWRGIVKMDMKKMPLYMTVSFAEIYESIVEGSKWENLSNDSKHEWRKKLNDIFKSLNDYITYDLPGEDRKRKTYKAILMENTWIKRRAVTLEDENRCLKEYGEVWEPFGVKVRVRGSLLFDFCWRKKNNNPSLVQVRSYDYNLKEIFGCKKGWNKSFAVIYAAWLVQYRNYWIKRGDGFNTCRLTWSRNEMKYAFNKSMFDINLLTTDEMCKVLDWYCINQVFNKNMKRPAHIHSYAVNKRCELSWILPVSLKDESVILKNDNGVNISLEDAEIREISDDIKLANSRMKGINEENNKHLATIDDTKISMSESVIYRVKYDKVLKENYIEKDKHGRCYSMANGVQSLKRQDRKRLKIDGKKVKEIDYSSLHPNMLYALNGIIFNKRDIYDVGNKWYTNTGLTREEARKAVKMMMLRMINAKNSSNAIYSFKKAWNEEYGHKNQRISWLYDLFDAINKAHSQISHEFCTGKGTYLMNLDGKLIREVCWRLTREKICALSIHDSVIVNEAFSDKAAEIMKEEYEKMFNGFTIKISCK